MSPNETGTVWVMRAGKVGEDRFPQWESSGVCAIGFHPVTGRLHSGITHAELEARVAKCYPDKTEAGVKRTAAMIGSFINVMRIDDTVAVVDHGKIRFGAVSGDFYDLTGDPDADEDGYLRRRSVRWLGTADPTADLAGVMKARSTIYRLESADNRRALHRLLDRLSGNPYAAAVGLLEYRATHRVGPEAITTVTTEPYRDPKAVELVIQRSGGFCENPECEHPRFQHFTQAGKPILQVDHVVDLALNGRDHPANMIAVCPNCHAIKTLSADGERWRSLFREAAAELHRRGIDGE
ncbi:HNH endonuclease [Catenulispora rubra]|uniref:HNH endonuclease n=1 Tax=Catenulispora rubra TaxID=280293 RepID=UPI0018927B6C|nr:HNH endonuclease [Catenulispora rubra]